MATATLKQERKPRLPTLYRFAVDQYLHMVEAGVLGPDDHVELHKGWIVQKMSRNPPHDGSLNYIVPILLGLLPAAWVLRIQSALVLAQSVPEPDLAIVRGPHGQYYRRHPGPADVGLLIEVADSSRLSDRQMKGGWYAEAKVAEFWLVNLVEGHVEVFTHPKSGRSPGYRQCKVYRKGDKVPLVLDGHKVGELAVADLCPVKA